MLAIKRLEQIGNALERIADALEAFEHPPTKASERPIGTVFAEAEIQLSSSSSPQSGNVRVLQALQELLTKLGKDADIFTAADVARRYTPDGLKRYLADTTSGISPATAGLVCNALEFAGLWDD